MQLRLLLLFFMLKIPYWVFGQQKLADSLSEKLQIYKPNDSIKMGLYISTAHALRFINVPKAIDMIEQGSRLAKSLNHPKGLCDANITRSHLYYQTGEFLKGAEIADTAIKIAGQIHDNLSMIRALTIKSLHLTQMSNYNAAIDLLHSVIRKSDSLNLKIHSASAYGNIGVIHLKTKNYEKAITYYQEALNIFLSLKDTLLVGTAYANIGSAYLELKNYQNAIAYNEKALAIAKKINSQKGIANSLLDLGISYGYLGQYKKGMQLLKDAVSIYQLLGTSNNLANAYYHISNLTLRLPDSLVLGDRFNEAITYQNKGIEIARKTKDLELLASQLEALEAIYQKKGDYKNAYNIYKEFILVRDSAFNNKKLNELARKEAEFENEKKTAVLQATHAAELRRQKTVRNFLIGGAGLLLATGGVLFWSYKRRRDAEELAQITDTQMKVLRLQMNPHFIFNSLSSISDYIRRNNVDEAGEYLTSFAKVMRLTLENSEQKEVPLADDLEALRLYMQLEAKRLNNKFTYSIDVADDIDQENILVPPMLLQPFAENSIWHGIGKKQGNGHITISIRKQNNMLHCCVEDDGVGRTGAAQQTAPGERKSLGMKITQSRIDMLNKLKNAKAAVQLTDKENGLKAEVILPLETAF
ncbi:MAG: tetratricopeptide repeat protein [Niabella sp.]